jgi:hypothetical protein
MSDKALPVAKFRLGRLVTTAHAQEALRNEDILAGIGRHQAGDWGEVDQDDRCANDRALVERNRIVSAYRSNGVRFWIITEPDRSSTTVLLPEDCRYSTAFFS